MSPTFDEMIELARRLGVGVRHAHLGGAGGGLAVVRGRRQLFVDLDSDPEDQLERTARAMAGLLGELDALYVRPDVRALLERYAERQDL